jgi:hypothetical protein
MLYADSKDMLVLSSTIASCYYSCYTDGSTSPGSHGHPPFVCVCVCALVRVHACVKKESCNVTLTLTLTLTLTESAPQKTLHLCIHYWILMASFFWFVFYLSYFFVLLSCKELCLAGRDKYAYNTHLLSCEMFLVISVVCLVRVWSWFSCCCSSHLSSN